MSKKEIYNEIIERLIDNGLYVFADKEFGNNRYGSLGNNLRILVTNSSAGYACLKTLSSFSSIELKNPK